MTDIRIFPVIVPTRGALIYSSDEYRRPRRDAPAAVLTTAKKK
jgi:hypothetical protein